MVSPLQRLSRSSALYGTTSSRILCVIVNELLSMFALERFEEIYCISRGPFFCGNIYLIRALTLHNKMKFVIHLLLCRDGEQGKNNVHCLCLVVCVQLGLNNGLVSTFFMYLHETSFCWWSALLLQTVSTCYDASIVLLSVMFRN